MALWTRGVGTLWSWTTGAAVVAAPGATGGVVTIPWGIGMDPADPPLDPKSPPSRKNALTGKRRTRQRTTNRALRILLLCAGLWLHARVVRAEVPVEEGVAAEVLPVSTAPGVVVEP